MTEETPRNFDGFILPDGEMVSIEDVDRMVSFLSGRMEDKDRLAGALWGLVQECTDHGHFGAAFAYADRILAMAETPAEKALCFLKMGQAKEGTGDFLAALETYSRAFELPQEKNDVWYFLNNNLAYCENHAGKHMEAVKHCRAAIRIDSMRHNAHKNLGVARPDITDRSEIAPRRALQKRFN